MNKKNIAIIIFVLVVILAIGGFWIWRNDRKAGVIKEVEKIENNQEQSQNQETEIDTSDWKTYRNEEYGFEVKYPEGWFVREDRGNIEASGRMSIYFSNYEGIFNKGNSPKDFLLDYIFVYDLNFEKARAEFVAIKKSKENVSDIKKNLYLENGEIVNFNICSIQEGNNNEGVVIPPVASAFIEKTNNGFFFSHASEIDENAQKKEIDILADMVKSFELLNVN